MRIAMIILLGALLFSSCGKKRTIVITATNAATGQPYAGLNYSIVSSVVGVDNGQGTKTVAFGVLDGNGEAVINLREKRNRRYAVRVVEPENTCYNKQITMYFDSPYDENGHFNFEFAECAYLTLSVNNVNCQDANDRILFDLQPSYIQDYNNIIPVEKFGCYSNTFVESQVPFGPWKATWEVTKNGVTTYHDSTFYMNINEHFNFVINY